MQHCINQIKIAIPVHCVKKYFFPKILKIETKQNYQILTDQLTMPANFNYLPTQIIRPSYGPVQYFLIKNQNSVNLILTRSGLLLAHPDNQNSVNLILTRRGRFKQNQSLELIVNELRYTIKETNKSIENRTLTKVRLSYEIGTVLHYYCLPPRFWDLLQPLIYS